MSDSERTARCSYYGKKVELMPANGSLFDCKESDRCFCERPSDMKMWSAGVKVRLPFYNDKPEREFDDFYCGCQGWS